MALVSSYRAVWRIDTSPLSCIAPYLRNSLTSSAAQVCELRDRALHLAVDASVDNQQNVEVIDELWIAITEGRLADVAALCKMHSGGQDSAVFPTMLDGSGASAIHVAASSLQAAASTSAVNGCVMSYLLSLTGVSEWVTHRNSSGLTPLMVACAAHNVDAVELLLAFDSSDLHINAANSLGSTALHIAVEEKQIAIVRRLCEWGAITSARALIRCDCGTASPTHLALSPVVRRFGATAVELAAFKQLPSDVLNLLASSGRSAESKASQLRKGSAAGEASKPLLTHRIRKGIAEALLAEGLTDAASEDIQAVMADLLRNDAGEQSFNDLDVAEVVSLIERISVSATILQPGETLEINQYTPKQCSGFNTHEFICLLGEPLASDRFEDELRRLGATNALMYFANKVFPEDVAVGDGGSIVRRFPVSFGWFANDMTIAMSVPVEVLALVRELHAEGTSVLFGASQGSGGRGFFFATRLLNTAQSLATQEVLQCVWLAMVGSVATTVSFTAPQSIVRSLLECGGGVRIINFQDAVAFACCCRDKYALSKAAEVSGSIPYESIFAAFTDAVAPQIRRMHASPLPPADLLTIALELHLDSFVLFLISSPHCHPTLRHLVTAAQRGTAASFQLLFSALGSSVSLFGEVDDVTGETVVTAAIKCGTCLHLTSLLPLASRVLNKTNRDGYSPLMVACVYGNESALLHLISLGADVNEIAVHGMTPLIAAIAGPLDRLVMPLVQSGAFVTVADAHGLTPMSAAEYFASSSLYPLLHEYMKRTSGGDGGDNSREDGALAKVDDAVACAEGISSSSLSKKTAELQRSLESYMADLATFIPELSSVFTFARPAREPSQDVAMPAIRAHAVHSGEPYTSLLKVIASGVLDCGGLIRAVLLEPDLRGFAKHPQIDMLFENISIGVSELLRRFRVSPPGEACLNVLCELVLDVLRVVRSVHRFAATVQDFVAPGGLERVAEEVARDPIWQRALRGISSSSASPLVVVPASVALHAVVSTSTIASEDSRLQDAILLLLDPGATGITTFRDFCVARERLDNFSADCFSSLQYVLACREVHQFGCMELARVWLERSVTGHVVLFSPTGICLLERQVLTESEVQVREFTNFSAFLSRVHNTLKTL